MTGKAHAYLDPGTGSLLMQGLIAAVTGALIFLRSPWNFVKNYFLRVKRRLSEKK
jgi:hypothetical protein